MQLIFHAYSRATQLADHGLILDLWMATGGPRQPLKGLFYRPTQKYLSQNLARLAALLKQLLAKCMSDCP